MYLKQFIFSIPTGSNSSIVIPNLSLILMYFSFTGGLGGGVTYADMGRFLKRDDGRDEYDPERDVFVECADGGLLDGKFNLGGVGIIGPSPLTSIVGGSGARSSAPTKSLLCKFFHFAADGPNGGADSLLDRADDAGVDCSVVAPSGFSTLVSAIVSMTPLSMPESFFVFSPLLFSCSFDAISCQRLKKKTLFRFCQLNTISSHNQFILCM